MRIRKEESIGLAIDIQERLFPHMHQHAELLRNTLILLEGFSVLDLPVTSTEQYPRGLGPTLEQIRDSIPNFQPVEKLSFSCCDNPSYFQLLQDSGKRNVIICGIETHVCVMQTVVDLLEKNYVPVVVTDCVSSRKIHDKQIALERMKQEGAVMATYESILFELARFAGNDTFKQISRLVK